VDSTGKAYVAGRFTPANKRQILPTRPDTNPGELDVAIGTRLCQLVGFSRSACATEIQRVRELWSRERRRTRRPCCDNHLREYGRQHRFLGRRQSKQSSATPEHQVAHGERVVYHSAPSFVFRGLGETLNIESRFCLALPVRLLASRGRTHPRILYRFEKQK
jgi:hypothetical protein